MSGIIITDYLRRYLRKDLDNFHKYLQIIAEEGANYSDRLIRRRDKLHLNAIKGLFAFVVDSKTFNDISSADRIYFLIDAMYYYFPFGRHEKMKKDEAFIYDVFIKECRKEDVLRRPEYEKWLIKKKGGDYWKWMHQILGADWEESKNESMKMKKAYKERVKNRDLRNQSINPET